MNAIEIKNLYKFYDNFSINDLNLTLPGGCILGLVGENGAGKSTTIKCILDIVHKDSGAINVLGKDNVKYNRYVKENVGAVLDEAGFNGSFTARQIGRIMRYTYENWDDSEYDRLLKALSVPLNKKFKEFSKGMKMKLGIAVALSHHAKLLILDEATSGLDPVVRDEITDLFMEFTRNEDHSVLISSHIVSDLEKICDYIAFIHEGRLLLCEEKDVLLNEYAIINCTEEQFTALDSRSVIGLRRSPYGVQAVVKKAEIPSGFDTSPVSLEELFVFMIRGQEK